MTGTLAGMASAGVARTAFALGSQATNIAGVASLNASTRHPGIDRDRASAIMRDSGLDIVVCCDPTNIHYLSGIYPLIDEMGIPGTSVIVLPANPKEPLLFVAPIFSYYYTMSEAGLPPNAEPRLYGSAGDEDPNLFLPATAADPSPREARRRANVETAKAPVASRTEAVANAIAELTKSDVCIGFDGPLARTVCSEAVPDAEARDGLTVLKHMRLIKTPFEIERMRIASSRNVEAAVKASRQMRELGSSGAFRKAFAREVAATGNEPTFLVVHGVSDSRYDEPLPEGTAVLLDAVTHFDHYHGDFGRTVFIGEPSREVGKIVNAMGQVWEVLRGELKPGMRFSEIEARGAELIAQIYRPLAIPYRPHSVGLAHTEQPFTALDGSSHDIALEAGMIVSIDMPLMEHSPHATVHLEDLTLITETGSELIHESVGPAIYS